MFSVTEASLLAPPLYINVTISFQMPVRNLQVYTD